MLDMKISLALVKRFLLTDVGWGSKEFLSVADDVKDSDATNSQGPNGELTSPREGSFLTVSPLIKQKRNMK